MTPVPSWLTTLAVALPTVPSEHLTPLAPPVSGGRPAAVLVLFAAGPAGPDLLLIERASTLRSHAGQPAFPGGAQDPEDDGPVGCALREATEEVGLQPASVQVLTVLPPLWLPPSGFVVHPVVGFWRDPHPVSVVDRNEVAAVVRVPIATLVDPCNRLQVSHPSGLVGPAFEVAGLLVWGFTAMLLDRLLTLGGWAVPWDQDRRRELDAETLRLSRRTRPAALPAPVEPARRPSAVTARPTLTQEPS